MGVEAGVPPRHDELENLLRDLPFHSSLQLMVLIDAWPGFGHYVRCSKVKTSAGALNFLAGSFPEACFGFVIPAKAGIQEKKDWMPDQVRHDEMRPIPRSLLRGSSFQSILLVKGQYYFFVTQKKMDSWRPTCPFLSRNIK
jgi:hypothetical protein